MHTIQYHSHPATRQDEWVVKTLGEFRGGYFVEVGAHDGVRHSNTLTLEEDFAWSGLLIEPDPSLFDHLTFNRPRCDLHCCAISDSFDDHAAFIFGDAYGGLFHQMPADWLAEHRRRETKVGIVETAPLDHVLQVFDAPEDIDYLSIDVEGAELMILKNYFAEKRKRRFKLITVEFRYDQHLLEQFCDLLVDYRLDEVRGFDACFIHKGM